MRHARIERWARGNSFLHRLHPTAKIICALILLISISSLQRNAFLSCGVYLGLLLCLALFAAIPLGELIVSAAAILPFAGSFALITLIAGQREQAILLILRSYLSSITALLLIGTTPMPALISGLEILRLPRFLLLVMQFLYRYLVVLFEEAAAIRDAGASRGGTLRALQLRQAGAAAGVLFARSYQRANAIHQAMLARGFEGSIPSLSRVHFGRWDTSAVIAMGAVTILIRIGV